ncbi:MAG: Crp/Fnr family transcriptional regulator [Eubacteriales bacterium]|nr:Crp/Fnr family transcriptional regulator [Eubacteriales bacterium]
MDFADYFPIFDKLTAEEQKTLSSSAALVKFEKGTMVHNGSEDCMGLLLIKSGQLRAFIRSDEGKEITVFRLFERDICLFSASCMMSSIQFDISIEAQKDTEAWLIPPYVYKSLMEKSAVIANYTNELMATRFTDVMWLVEQVMWKSMDKRIALFLCEESDIENTDELKITHEQIGSHLGTAREVVTRILKYLQAEGVVALTRGTVTITDREKLNEIAYD